MLEVVYRQFLSLTHLHYLSSPRRQLLPLAWARPYLHLEDVFLVSAKNEFEKSNPPQIGNHFYPSCFPDRDPRAAGWNPQADGDRAEKQPREGPIKVHGVHTAKDNLHSRGQAGRTGNPDKHVLRIV